MNIYTLNPLTDPRWTAFIGAHKDASIFHHPSWLSAIQKTYGYTPVVYTTAAPSEPLANGLVGCHVNSWLTGRRFVSVPFSDHCEPLFDRAETAREITNELCRIAKEKRLKYVELRPANSSVSLADFAARPAAYLHTLDLTPAPDEILRRTHKTAIQQPIKRAEREKLICESGYSKRLLEAFYRLTVLTRRRQQLPPQPIAWFRNLAATMGKRLQIRVAFKGNEEIAGILTLQHEETLVYKYGCSNAAFQNLGATPLLLWQAILDAKQAGLTRMDFGRSDADNAGLITFKTRWGAVPAELRYLRWSRKQTGNERVAGAGLAGRIFARMPGTLLQAAGGMLYRHVG